MMAARRVFTAATVALLAVGVASAFARSGPAPAHSKPAAAKTVVLRGAVERADASRNTLTVTWQQKKKNWLGRTRVRQRRAVVDVRPETRILSHEESIPLSDLKAGAPVKVTAVREHRHLVAKRIEIVEQARGSSSPGPRR
jgi:hypothetical protein